MKKIGVLIVLLCMSLLTIKGQPVTINGITYSHYKPTKKVGNRIVTITEMMSIESVSPTISGNITIPSEIEYKGKMLPVRTINSRAFLGCSKITSITIPSSISRIGDYAFKNCTGLVNIKFVGKEIGIARGVFYNCYNLVSVELPEIKNGTNYERHFPSDLFYECTSLAYVTIPSSITSITYDTFRGCINLKDIFCYALDAPTLSDKAFEGVNPMQIRVHVPKESLPKYMNSKWNQFKSIDTNMQRPQVNRQAKIQGTDINTNEIKAIDMGGSVMWANMNLESTTPLDPGGIFAWGETSSRTGNFTYSNYTEPKLTGLGRKIYDGVKGTKYDAAKFQWGHGWRMPTEDEFKELYNNCTKVTHEKEKYVELIAYNGNRLILPLPLSADITRNGIGNFYWTSNSYSRDPICCEYSEWWEEKFTTTTTRGYYGGLIRPVKDKRNTDKNVKVMAVPKIQPQKFDDFWFIFGTRKELEEQGIITNNQSFPSKINKNNLTKIDKYVDTEIKFWSKKVKILTDHPVNSYELVLDEKQLYKLVITNPDVFWSESNILVVLVY